MNKEVMNEREEEWRSMSKERMKKNEQRRINKGIKKEEEWIKKREGCE
jgi:hypothetical protein